MKVSEFQKKLYTKARLHNDLNLPKRVNQYHEAIGRSAEIVGDTYDCSVAADICEAAYIEFITCAFEISLDTIIVALAEVGLLSQDK